MKRRAFLSGVCVLASGASGMLGFWLGQSSVEERFDFHAFLQGNLGVKFNHMPPELLLKLYSRSLSDADRQELIRTLVDHNRALFVNDPYARTLGAPGFYRVEG